MYISLPFSMLGKTISRPCLANKKNGIFPDFYGIFITSEISVPKRPVRTMGRQSGQSGHGFEKPGSVRLKLSTAAKACRRPGNRRVERIGDRQMPM